MTARFFEASSIEVGFCKSPTCIAVHIQLVDAAGVPRAQGCIGCEGIEALVADLRTVRDRILRGRASVGRH